MTEFGLPRLDIYAQEFVAEGLYRDSEWRQLLLGIPGNLPALSSIPQNRRSDTAALLVGRTADLEWLLNTSGDLLVLGPPGSGKTHLHHHVAEKRAHYYFVESEDESLIADGIRDLDPKVLVVDDAHMSLPLVRTLRRIRDETGVEFAIHANAWPGFEHGATEFFDASCIRELDPLSGEQVLELLKELGVGGPNQLLHLLVSEAGGKPGLAASMARACLEHGVDGIWSGEVVAKALAATIREMKDRVVLAIFSLGGDDGMDLPSVAEAMSISEVDVLSSVTLLANGGVVDDISKTHIQVRPPSLRGHLVRQVFFSSPGLRLPESILEKAAPAEAAHVLMQARRFGGDVPTALLEDLVVRGSSRDAWEHFAVVDEECARMVLDRYPERIEDASRGLLQQLPHQAIVAILEREFTGSDRSRTRREKRSIIRRWVGGDEPLSGVTVGRRRKLLAAIDEWAVTHERLHSSTYGHALACVIQPGFFAMHSRPGSRGAGIFYRGSIQPSELSAVAQMWTDVIVRLEKTSTAYWAEVMDAVGEWCFPLSLGGHLPSSILEMMHEKAAIMVRDIAELSAATRAVRSWAYEQSRAAQLGVAVEPDELFELLYGEPFGEDYIARRKGSEDGLREHAVALAKRRPREVLQELAAMDVESREVQPVQGRWQVACLARHMAGECDMPLSWLREGLLLDLSVEYVVPFLDRCLADDQGPILPLLAGMLAKSNYRRVAAWRVLELDPPDEELLGDTLVTISDVSFSVRDARFRHIPIPTAIRLLTHDDVSVRTQAAMGEAMQGEPFACRTELLTPWRQAVLEIREETDYPLPEVLKDNDSLAFDWCRGVLGDESQPRLRKMQGAFQAASSVLDRDQRLQLLLQFSVARFDESCFHTLLCEDFDIFRDWLAQVRSESVKLRPLDIDVGPRWETLAAIALDQGFTPSDISEHSRAMFPTGGSDYFQDRVKAYEALTRHSDSRFHETGRVGLSRARPHLQDELDEEQRERGR